ncbi:MaoC family dehydratase [Nitratireductor aquimarinus]|uniref:MaoC family dehydratase n=1 Tax=Nitratireductor TaxID=245876 RepID=UPI0019D36E1D|nr:MULTISPECIES: MaoC family dehydratase [Nitratireductor]MBN7763805.1 MaoC family dehydratase [Nitratireductor aquibiodomus]MBN8242650.1 MaoC family dehydratase [Nitratireductor aquimarinus]MBY6131750.1 MaoC family dehydratase [Nitratireductor aquimarinus]MCA1301287.1 MaoC family dehydratase [Nitratireductor aquimarinus]MCV0380253.1 MaoC family dehydratase [Nitratireductor sp.]
MTDKKWAFEDLEPGLTIPFSEKTVSAEEIIAFARQFDAQPMHLDEEAGKASILGGLAASGWHSCAMFMRMLYDAFLVDSTSQGSPGITDARWKRPVIAGDTLSGQTTVLERRPLKSRPGIGLVTFRHLVTNQRGETVMEMENPIMFRMRATGAAA